MKTYAIVQAGKVINVVVWDGDIAGWKAEDDQIAIEIGEQSIAIGDAFNGSAFIAEDRSAPAAILAPEQIQLRNSITRDQLLSSAAIAIAPLQDAVDLDLATSQTVALLKAWKQYRVALSHIDITGATPAWPEVPS